MKKQGRRNLRTFRSLKQSQINIQGEAEYIIRRAKRRESRIVTLPPLILFSITTGDAWMIDPQEHLALCLARCGQEEPFNIYETETNFAVEWNSTYWIDQDLFVVSESSGRTGSIIDCPVTEIKEAIQNMR